MDSLVGELRERGIGAGAKTDGQVLVITDLLGFDATFHPKFVRRYVEGHAMMLGAVNSFVRDVRAGKFPSPEEILA